MDILFVTPAISPYHPNCEIGDVNRALAKALRGLGHRVTVLSPLYAGSDPSAHALARKLSTIEVEVDGDNRECAVYTGRTTGGVELVFIAHDPTFQSGPADADSAAARTAAVVLCRAAARYATKLEQPPEIVHGHGFQAALAAALCQAQGIACGSVLSLYDTRLEGRPAAGEAERYGLPEALLTSLQDAGSLLGFGMARARSVVDSQAALSALGSFDDEQAVPAVITHAVDASVWNSLTDPLLEARFDPANMDGKDRCKGALQYAAELPVLPEVPLLAVLGADAPTLLQPLMEGLLRNEVQVVIGVDAETADTAAILATHGDRVRTLDVTDQGPLHQLLGGADFLLLSPAACARGTLQLSAQRYGALPIVHAGSLLSEQVVDCDPECKTGSGFVYADGAELSGTLSRALATYGKGEAFGALRNRVMRIDTSWDRAARRFEHVYRKALPNDGSADAS